MVSSLLATIGRKRNKGKARKARKAAQAATVEEQRFDQLAVDRLAEKAAQAAAAMAEEELRQEQMMIETIERFELAQAQKAEEQFRQSMARQKLQQYVMNNNAPPECMHGSKLDGFTSRFVFTFNEAFNVAACKYPYVEADLLSCLTAAKHTTLREFANVWNDSTKMKMAISWFLFVGTQNILGGNYDDARDRALMVRYLEQYVAVKLEQTQAQMNFPKLIEACHADMHSLVKFLRRRIPCSCLDEKYQEVKCITKMGMCFNPQCNLPNCSRCRCVAYCSSGCQRADWMGHKRCCDTNSAIKAEFEAKQQNM